MCVPWESALGIMESWGEKVGVDTDHVVVGTAIDGKK